MHPSRRPAAARSLAAAALAILAVLPALPVAPAEGPVPLGGGAEPGTLPAVGRPTYVEVTGEAGLGGWTHGGFLGTGNQTSSTYFTEFTGPGACWLDADRDGRLDLYLVSGIFQTHAWKNALQDPHAALFRNVGGAFAEVSDATGARLQGTYQGCSAADYDDDGWTDLYVTGWGGNVLLRNAGGTFVNVTDAAGVRDAQCGDFRCWGSSATWWDYDKDGCLDLWVNHFTDYDPDDPPPMNAPGPGQKNRLFHSRCDGTFEDRTAAARLDNEKSDSWSSVSADFDEDGWPDLYVANDGDFNDLYLNNGDGTFRHPMTVANNNAQAGMGSAFADADHDGDIDLITTNYIGQFNGVFFDNGPDYLNRGGEAPFSDALSWVGWAAHWYDINRDANMDLLVINGMTEDTGLLAMEEPLLAYEGTDGLGAFRSIRTALGDDVQGEWVGRGGAWADYDDDGDIDFVLAEAGEAPTHLFRADGTGGTFLSLELVGTAPTVTRDAIGAVARVTPEGLPTQLLVRHAGSGFLGSNDPRLHAGMAYAERADVEVTWPDGSVQRFDDVRANTFLRITQGQAQPEVLRALPIVRVTGPAEGQRLAPLTFRATALPADGAGIASVSWDFGGQGGGSGLEASHAFDDVGAFTVRATVTDTLGRAATQATQVVVRDALRATVEPDRARFLPAEPATGNVTVRFSDGAPVAGARVQLTLRYTTGDPAADAALRSLPRAVRDLIAQQPSVVEGVTDAQGRVPYAMPFTLVSPAERAPFAMNHPGQYIGTAVGGARGSVFAEAQGGFIVLAALPPAGP